VRYFVWDLTKKKVLATITFNPLTLIRAAI
jgi:hypothetical protein